MKIVDCLKCQNHINQSKCKYSFQLAVDSSGEAAHCAETVYFCINYEETEINQDNEYYYNTKIK